MNKYKGKSLLEVFGCEEEALRWKKYNLKRRCNSQHESQHKYDRQGNRVLVKLTFDEYKQLMEEAGITADDIGNKRGKYALARHNDLGHYEMGNCRFVTTYENAKENHVHRRTNSEGLKKYSAPSTCIVCRRHCPSLMSLHAHYRKHL